MRGKLLAILVLSLVVIGANKQPAQAAAKDDSIESLMDKWADSPNVLNSYYADYDGDGKKEVFAITGKSEQYSDTIYYASTKWAGKLYKAQSAYAYTDYGKHICKISDKKKLFVMEFGAGGSGSYSVCYYVNKGKPYRSKDKGLEGLEQLSGKEFVIHPSFFDNFKSSDGNFSGHTWKRYWLKWNGKKFVEYKGKYISERTLRKYKNGSSILKKIKKTGYSVGEIIKRGNGIININLRLRTSYDIRYENVTLLLKKKKLTVQYIKGTKGNIVDRSSYGGIYRKSVRKLTPV